MSKYDCGICSGSVTDKDIEHSLAFEIKHTCGRTVWYHLSCAMEVVDGIF